MNAVEKTVKSESAPLRPQPAPPADASSGAQAILPDSASGLAAFSRVPVTVEVQLGTSRLPLPQLLALEPGSTLVLNQNLGSPVILFVNGCAIAKGELYVLEDVGEQLGVKITELLVNAER
jgi:flagellar motor switch protein FliN